MIFDPVKALGKEAESPRRTTKIGIRPTTESELSMSKPRNEDRFYVVPGVGPQPDRRAQHHGTVSSGPATLEVNAGPNLVSIPMNLGERDAAIVLALKLQQLSVKREEVAYYQGIATFIFTVIGTTLLIIAGALGASNQPYRQP